MITEDVWQAVTDADTLLDYMPVSCSPRLASLLGCGWYRIISPSIPLRELDWVVSVIEKASDEVETLSEWIDANAVVEFALNVTRGSAEWIPPEFKSRNAYAAALAVYRLRQIMDRWSHFATARPHSLRENLELVRPGFNFLDLSVAAKRHFHTTRIALLRCIVGNPFRPVAFDPRWRTEHTVGIARKMYDDRDFAAMPILADALEEAGCAVEAVLLHCRESGPHARGCWVVDGVLGKR